MHIENMFLGRHKFYHLRVWYRDELSDYVQEVLLDNRTLSRSYLESRSVEKIVDGHVKGYQNNTTGITRLMTIEIINRILLRN